MCFTLVTLVYDFLSGQVSQAHLPSILWLVAFTWVLGGLVSVSETWAGTASESERPALLAAGAIYASVTLGGALLFAALHVVWLRWLNDPANVPASYCGAALVLLLVTARALFLGEALPKLSLTPVVGLAASGLVALTTFLVLETNMDVVRADICYKQARVVALPRGQYDWAVALMGRALELQPGRDAYHSFLGQALTERAQRVPPSPERDALFREAARSFSTAKHLSPLDPDHAANLAHLYGQWARHTQDPAEKRARFEKALALNAEALDRSPSNVLLWNERGAIYFFMGDGARAMEAYQHSLALDDAFAATYLGLAAVHEKQGRLEEAIIRRR